MKCVTKGQLQRLASPSRVDIELQKSVMKAHLSDHQVRRIDEAQCSKASRDLFEPSPATPGCLGWKPFAVRLSLRRAFLRTRLA